MHLQVKSMSAELWFSTMDLLITRCLTFACIVTGEVGWSDAFDLHQSDHVSSVTCNVTWWK
jgi:hypothetical protein